jgi:hypothetical protein
VVNHDVMPDTEQHAGGRRPKFRDRTAAAAAGAPSGATTSGALLSSRRTRGILAGIVGLVIVGVGAWQVLSSSSQQSPTAPATTTAATPATVVLPAGNLGAVLGAPLTVQAIVPPGGGGHLSDPHEAVAGPGHTIYVADPGAHAVVVYGAQGSYQRAITASGSAALQAPFSLVLASGGHLFVLDAEASHIVEYAGLGKTVVQTMGTFGRAIARDAAGNIYLANPARNNMAVYSDMGRLVRIVQTPLSAMLGQFNQPSAVSVARDGSIFVLDNTNERIEKFTPDWKAVGQWPAPPSDTFHSAHVLALSPTRFLVSDPRGSLLDYDISTNPATIHRYALAGVKGAGPVGLALLDKDHVLVTDNANRAVWSVPLPTGGK